MGKQQYYYAVQKGIKEGVFNSWEDCKQQVSGYKGAKYKKFPTYEAAQAFARGDNPDRSGSGGGSFYGGNNYSSSPTYSTTTLRAGRLKIVESEPAPTKQLKSAIMRRYDTEEQEVSTYHNKRQREEDIEEELLYLPKRRQQQQQQQQQQQLSSTTNHIVYTDGASRGNGRKGARAGYGVYWGEGDKRNISAPLIGERQTNQRAEATAILEVLKQTHTMEKPLEIRTDSQYCIKAMTEWHHKWRKNDWKNSLGKPVENRDLFEPMLRLASERRGKVSFVYVPGHSGVHGNEMADQLAVKGAEKGLM